MEIFKNKDFQNELDHNGYIVLNVLNEKEVIGFHQEYNLIQKDLEFNAGVHITMEHSSPNLAKEISNTLISKVKGYLNQTFENYKLFQGSFIAKEQSSTENKIHHHQDWSFVDESIGNNSYTLWIALCDITYEMGTIGVIPKSHLDFNNIRYSPIEKYKEYSKVLEYVKDKTVQKIELKAGQAVLWNHKLIHSSGINKSSKVRLNMTFAITSNTAQLKLFWMSPRTNEVTEFNVPDNFYSMNNSKKLYFYYHQNVYPQDAVEVIK